MAHAQTLATFVCSSALMSLAVNAGADARTADRPASTVDLGQVCRGLPARGRASVTLAAARPAATRRIRSGSPATQLLLNLTPVDRAAGVHDIDVVLLPAREGRIARALDLPGSPRGGGEQVLLLAQVVECGVPATSTQELALFLDAGRPASRAAVDPARAEAAVTPPSQAASRGPPLPLFAPDRKRAIEERRRWCEQRQDPYDTHYLGSGFVPLPWLDQPGWVYVSTEYDQAPPLAHQRAVWTRARSLRNSDWPRLQGTTWQRVASIRADALPRLQSMRPYSVSDCRQRLWDDYFEWTAVQEDSEGDGTGAADGAGAPAAGSGASRGDPDLGGAR